MSVARLAHHHASASTHTLKTLSCREHAQRSHDTAPLPRVGIEQSACRRAPNRWLTPRRRDQLDAAAACSSCPLATVCLITALRLDAAHGRGEDPYGVYGVYGGVWFEPGRTPQRIRTITQDEARRGHAAYERSRARGAPVPEPVAEAERAYQQYRKRAA